MEVMVALLIGMLTVLVMMQVFSAAEGRKRTTVGAGNAQTSGAAALFSLQRDIRQAGYGFAYTNVMGCAYTLPSGTQSTVLAPVVINPAETVIPAGDANTDRLLVFYGDASGSPEGDSIGRSSSTPDSLKLTSTIGYQVNDRLILTPNAAPSGTASCTISAIPAIASVVSATQTVTLNSAPTGHSNTEPLLYNLGQQPHLVAYRVRNATLEACDYFANDCSANNANWTPVETGIVSLRAEYGKVTSATSGIAVWNQTTPATTTHQAAACDLAKTLAVRLVVVSRNGQMEKENVTAAGLSWSGNVPITLSGNADWQKYRYRLVETTIPLRNMSPLEPPCI